MRQHFGGTVVLDERLRAARHAPRFRLAKASRGLVPTGSRPLHPHPFRAFLLPARSGMIESEGASTGKENGRGQEEAERAGGARDSE